MKVLAYVHGPPGSGNDSTICRIARHLVSLGHSVRLVREAGDPQALARTAHRWSADLLIGTHAQMCAAPFAEAGRPYVLLFGGTDLNEHALDPVDLEVMTRAVTGAAALVAFNLDFVQRCLTLWPAVQDKLHHIPQAADTWPAPGFAAPDAFGLPPDARLLLLPAGLRPVKDPLMLVDCVHRWHAEDPRIHMVIAGVSYDPEFEGIVRRRCGAGAGARYVGSLSRADLQAAMGQATAVLNTSLSECSPNAVLEAMRLHCPVVVRDIPGNTCLVRHDVNGLVFNDPLEFRQQVQRLLDDTTLRTRLGRAAARSVLMSHGLRAERAAYAHLLTLVATQAPPPRADLRGRGAPPPSGRDDQLAADRAVAGAAVSPDARVT